MSCFALDMQLQSNSLCKSSKSDLSFGPRTHWISSCKLWEIFGRKVSYSSCALDLQLGDATRTDSSLGGLLCILFATAVQLAMQVLQIGLAFGPRTQWISFRNPVVKIWGPKYQASDRLKASYASVSFFQESPEQWHTKASLCSGFCWPNRVIWCISSAINVKMVGFRTFWASASCALSNEGFYLELGDATRTDSSLGVLLCT